MKCPYCDRNELIELNQNAYNTLYDCPLCGLVYSDSDDFIDRYPDDDESYEDYATCGCRFCYCHNHTIAGETCNDCLSGSHQG